MEDVSYRPVSQIQTLNLFVCIKKLLKHISDLHLSLVFRSDETLLILVGQTDGRDSWYLLLHVIYLVT